MMTSSDSPPRTVNFDEKSLEDTPGKRLTARVMSSAQDMFLMSFAVMVCRDKGAPPMIEKRPGVTVTSLSEKASSCRLTTLRSTASPWLTFKLSKCFFV